MVTQKITLFGAFIIIGLVNQFKLEAERRLIEMAGMSMECAG